MVGKDAAALCVTGYPFLSKIKMTGLRMFIYTDTAYSCFMNETVQHPERVRFSIPSGVDGCWSGEGVMGPDFIFLPEFCVKTMRGQMLMLRLQCGNILGKTCIEQTASGYNVRINIQFARQFQDIL
ncbi:hypothetical protein D3C75_1123730 [compost metagenome]